MTKHRIPRLRKMALVMAGLSAAVLSIGATEPLYPEVSRGDQMANLTNCAVETVDGLKVCAREARYGIGVTVTTVAAGLTIVE
ncbi:hypothetical protein [Pleomorphomonas sp. JP5]|uniref:hypothetical protein n=1 Tax=Pleomorphomonas sp. JP5 TaxID=2942998 RepID=UPI0020443772|nr:hypothetical protein [Pleomorphomonas sp. JP5]MCM5560158.1 hypothetical protein [Pleomorphomonas sp. JP5]